MILRAQTLQVGDDVIVVNFSSIYRYSPRVKMLTCREILEIRKLLSNLSNTVCWTLLEQFLVLNFSSIFFQYQFYCKLPLFIIQIHPKNWQYRLFRHLNERFCRGLKVFFLPFSFWNSSVIFHRNKKTKNTYLVFLSALLFLIVKV